MSLIDISVFKAAIPLIEPELLPPENAADLLDCNIDRGSLAPVKGDLLLSDPIEADTETVYHTGNKLYQWPGLVDVARSFDDLDSKRIVFTGSGYPKETDTALGDTGAGPWPAATRRNGLPAPVDPPGILMGGTSGEDTQGIYSWVYTYFFTRPDGSEIESSTSPPTADITILEGETITLTALAYPSPSVEGCSYSGIRIYRMQATEASALYHFVQEQANLNAWLDDVSDLEASANAILETMNMSTGYPVAWSTPVEALSGITKVNSGFFVGFSGEKIYPSVLFVSFAFPGKYSLSADSLIKAIGSIGSVVVALTDDRPHFLIGQDPATVSFKSVDYSRPCLGDNRSVISTPGGVIFPSHEGFFLIDATGVETSLTGGIFTPEQWAALNPSTFISFLYRGKLVAMEAGTQNIHIIDTRRGRYERAQADDGIIRAAYQKKEDGTIYMVVDNATGRELRQWRGGDVKPLFWKSKTFDLGTKAFYSRALVRGNFSDGKTAKITLDIDGVDKDFTVTKAGMLNLGRIRANEVIAKLSGTATIKRVIIGSSAREVLNV